MGTSVKGKKKLPLDFMFVLQTSVLCRKKKAALMKHDTKVNTELHKKEEEEKTFYEQY